MRTNQLKIGSLLSYLQIAVSILIGLIYTPVMLRLLGRSEYGLYNTVYSIISLISILGLSFNNSYIRYYAEYKSLNQERRIDSLNGVFLLLFSCIGLVALICGIFLTFNLELVFDQGLTPSEYKTARILMFIMTLNMAISFPMSTFTSIISAHERYVFLKLVGILKTVVSPLLTLPLLLIGFRSIALVTVTVITTLIADLIYLLYAKRRLNMRFVFKGFDKRLINSLFQYTAFIVIHIVVDQINNNMDKFLLGRFVGTGEVAVYAVGFNLYHYYISFSVGISAVFSPRIHKIVNTTRCDLEEQRLQLTTLFTKIGRIQFVLLGLLASGLVFFGKEFIHFWAGEGYQNSYYVALLLVVPATVPFIQNAGIEIQRALNKHRFANICYLFMALINLIVSIQLCKKFGAVGSAAGTAMSFIVANGILINIYYHKVCNVDVIIFWKNILRVAVGLVSPIIIGCIMKSLFSFYQLATLIFGIIVYTVIYCASMWFVGMNEYEKKLLHGFLSGIQRKKR